MTWFVFWYRHFQKQQGVTLPHADSSIGRLGERVSGNLVAIIRRARDINAFDRQLRGLNFQQVSRRKKRVVGWLEINRGNKFLNSTRPFCKQNKTTKSADERRHACVFMRDIPQVGCPGRQRFFARPFFSLFLLTFLIFSTYSSVSFFFIFRSL